MEQTLPSKLQLEIVTPDRRVVQDSVISVSIPGKNGELGILPGHAPLLTELKIGELVYVRGGQTQHLAVSWGFAEVLPDRVIVLAQTAERAEEIDVSRAEESRRRAEERLKKVSDSDVDQERARAALDRALVRLQAAQRTRPKT